MANFPGPYELEFELSNPAFTYPHVMRMQCNAPVDIPLGSLLTNVSLMRKNGTSILVSDAIEQAWSFFRLIHATATTCSLVRLWKYTPSSYAKSLVNTYNIVGTATGNTGTAVSMQYVILSFYTGAGGQAKLFIPEPSLSSQAQVPISSFSPTAPQAQIATYLVSGDSVMIGRDNGYLISAYRFSAGQHEKYWQDVNR